MKLHRFFVNQNLLSAEEVVIRDSDLYHQLRNVFRFTVGGQVILLDNTGYEYLAIVSSFGKGDVSFSIASKRMGKNIPEKEIYLFCSIVKKDKFEWVLEKGTELGVSHFIPLLSDRSEKKDINEERALKILKEASEQSERSVIPSLEQISSLEDALSREISKICFDPKGQKFVSEAVHTTSTLGVFIGPEGGWTEREIFLFKKYKVPIYSLGKGILKTETAVVSSLSLILL